jgi:Zn-finger nucleic acid-binding protein
MTTGIVSYCFFCGSGGPAGSACPSCLVTIPRPAPEIATSFACPRCTSGATTPLLAIGIAPSATIHACQGCHGIFVGARAWCTLVARPELARAIASRLPAREAPSSELVRLLRCPACAKEMERGRFGASSNIVIDVCVAHGIWLDSGEVVAVADHAALRARVGVQAARRATNAAESGPHDGNLAAAQAEATMAAASLASRKQTVKRTGLILFLALVALRVGLFIARGGSAAPPEIRGAGESAGQAATALGNR